ncbi:polysaccharide biosynthesis C-terminal domain-containing protein [Mucilaginibacter boryungensis]|uniref:Polysaccharide biosynthesis protein n=1 Tax=Mucilaginibacter boryungensis TaxID=768480 RepID=A0ABR9XCK5_9SPHI|nr:oligosaccharide flippase family protein [Mucilaginibacter boryungensis]MBE9664779.1 polysaccharide biosynthesis protein [Mucilaginibacter boryungensis]
MSTAKKFAGQTAIYGLSTIASRTLNFFLTSAYTRIYSKSIYGIFSNMFSYASMLQALMAFGMETTFFRYLNKHEDRKSQVYNNAFAAIMGITLIFLAVSLLFINQITRYIAIEPTTSYHDYKLYALYFISFLVIDAWCVVPFAKVRADGRPGRYGIIKMTNVLTFIGLNLLFMYGLPFVVSHHYPGAAWISSWFRKGWLGYIFLSNLAASAITLVLLLPEVLKFKLNLDKPIFRNMLVYSFPVLVANFSFIINENLDKMLLAKILPENIASEQLGIYAACAKISIFLNLFVQAFRLGAEPFFFSHAKNKNAGHTYSRIMDYFVIAVSLGFLGIIANIELLKYFIGSSYWVGLQAVPPLLFGYVSLGVYMNLSIWYKLSDQTRYGLYISGIGAVITIVLNIALIPKFSYMASAWASFASYSVMMVLSYAWGQKNYPIPYHLKKNLAYIIISIILVYLSFYVFNRNIFVGNALLILFAGGAFLMEGKELKAILIKR